MVSAQVTLLLFRGVYIKLPMEPYRKKIITPSYPLEIGDAQIREVLDSEKNIILMIDEIHTLVGAGGTGDGGSGSVQGSPSPDAFLKPISVLFSCFQGRLPKPKNLIRA